MQDDPREQSDDETFGGLEPAADRFPVVGIGASAGGVEALIELFSKMPAGHGIAFVVMLHLDPNRESRLAEILGREVDFPVETVDGTTRLQPDRVYVAPATDVLVLNGGRLHLADREEASTVPRSIDRLFESLAEDAGRRAVAIVLSGSGSDGTLGLRSIKECGGMAIAQDPETAGQPSMPRHAIDSGLVDMVVEPGEIPGELLRYLDHSYVRDPLTPSEDDLRLGDILGFLRDRTGRSLHHYRRSTLGRRVLRRMGLRQVEDAEAYLVLLREDRNEVENLLRDLMIHVSGFFRDEEAWRTLGEKAIRPLLREVEPGRTFRAWTPGCATGEEAYSLAMLLTEAAEGLDSPREIKVFATDVVGEVVEEARRGVYPPTITAEVSPSRLNRFFELQAGRYRVRRELRDRVVFAPHDLLADPPFSRLDLVTCRNLLIYIEPRIQSRVIALLHFALREGGIAFLGPSETVGPWKGELFEPVSRQWRIFRRLGPTRHELVEFGSGPGPGPEAKLAGEPKFPPKRFDLAGAVRAALVDRFAPPSVLVDQQLEIRFYHGDTEPFLQQPTGAPTRSLLELLRPELRVRARRILERVAAGEEERGAVDSTVRRSDELYPVRIEIAALGAEAPGRFLVSFEERAEPETVLAESPATGGDRENRDLEAELHRTRKELHSTVGELETSNEELRASNEEVVSMNEELQSTNEELETSKEELQSFNEELETVNSQLQAKVAELEDTTNDLSNLLNSTSIATLFLDRHFRIRRWTPAIGQLVDILPSDLGRPLSHLAWKFTDPELVDDAEKVLAELAPLQREVENEGDHIYLRRVTPYRTEDDRVDGVVVTFTDITGSKETERELARVNEDLEREMEQRSGFVQLLLDVTVIANASRRTSEAIESVLNRICERNSWEVGHALLLDTEGHAVSTEIWTVGDGIDHDEVQRTLGEESFPPGSSWVGRVLASGEAHWKIDLEGEGFRRLGLRSGLFFPIRIGLRIVGVMEFFSPRRIEPSPPLLQVMSHVGTQLGRVLERDEAEGRIEELALKEQERIGVELHDTLGQILTGMGMSAESLRAAIAEEAPEHEEALDALVEKIETAHDRLRDLCRTLSSGPIDAERFVEALGQLVDHYRSLDRGPELHLELDPEVETFDERTCTYLYRIAREALHNAVRHGRPDRVDVRLQVGGEVVELEVEDDGDGVDGDPWSRRGLGLTIMRQSADVLDGRLEIHSEPGDGSRVVCRLPVSREQERT